MRCPDCHAPAAEGPYCPACGLRRPAGALTLRELGGESLAALASFELPILRTTGALLRSPGRTTRRWIAGERRSLTHPVKLLILVGFVAGLAYPLLLDARAERVPLGGARYSAGLADKSQQFLAPFAVFLMVPITGILWALATRLSPGRRWVEWWTLSIYCVGLGVLLQLAAMGASLLLLETAAPRPLVLLEGALPFLVLFWGAFGFGSRPLGAVLSAVLGVALTFGAGLLLTQAF